MEDRIKSAIKFIDDIKIQGDVLCDSMNDELMKNYDAFPDRIVIIINETIVHDGGPADTFGMKYNVESVIEWLEENVKPCVGKEEKTVQEEESACEICQFKR